MFFISNESFTCMVWGHIVRKNDVFYSGTSGFSDIAIDFELLLACSISNVTFFITSLDITVLFFTLQALVIIPDHSEQNCHCFIFDMLFEVGFRFDLGYFILHMITELQKKNGIFH